MNGIVAGVIALMSLRSFAVTITMNEAELREAYERVVELQPNVPSMMNAYFYATLMRVAAYVSLVFGLTTGLHVVMSFKLVKKFGYLFQSQEA